MEGSSVVVYLSIQGPVPATSTPRVDPRQLGATQSFRVGVGAAEQEQGLVLRPAQRAAIATRPPVSTRSVTAPPTGCGRIGAPASGTSTRRRRRRAPGRPADLQAVGEHPSLRQAVRADGERGQAAPVDSATMRARPVRVSTMPLGIRDHRRRRWPRCRGRSDHDDTALRACEPT